MFPVRYALAFGILGITSMIAQVLLLRESVVLARGNELSIGIVLGNWILAAGLGSALAGRNASRSGRARELYSLLQTVVSVLLPLSVLAARTSRHWLGLPPWEALGVGRVAWATFVFVAPVAFVSGAMFALGCRMLEETEDPGAPGRAPARVYALESAGAVLGAGALSFLLLGRVKPVEIALSVSILNLASAFSLLCSGRGLAGSSLYQRTALGNGTKAAAACLLVLTFWLLLTPGARLLEDRAWALRWKPLLPLESVDSVYGNVNAVSLGEQVVFYENGMPTLAAPFPEVGALEESVHIPMLSHPEPRIVLLLGGGVGGAIREALKHPLAGLTYAEIDPALVRTAEKYGGPLVRAELEEPRVRVVYEDGRSFLLRSLQKFDVILLRVPEASTVQMNRYFTQEFFERVRARLHTGGIFSFSMPGSEAHLSEDLARTNRCVEETLREVFPSVRILPGERNLFLASTGSNLAEVTAEGLEAKRIERGIETRWLGPDSLQYRINADREAWLHWELERTPQIATNRDLRPVLVRYFLWHQYEETSAGKGKWVSVVRRLGPAGVVAAFGAIALLPVMRLGSRPQAPRFALSYVVFTTGAVAMALEMAALLLFQSLYGYVYQWLGGLIAAFMAGLAGGSLAAARWVWKGLGVYPRVLWLEGLLLGFVLLLALALAGFSGLLAQEGGPAWPFKPVLVGFMIAGGFLAGAEYPLAVKGAFAAGPSGQTLAAEAGRLYALDLAGAFTGTLLLGVVLVPWIGIPATLGACAAWKAVSFGCLGRAAANR